LLTGALIGQVSPSAPWAVVGGLASHVVLDSIPHAEGKTFGLQAKTLFRPDVVAAGVEALVGAAGLWRFMQDCPGAHAGLIALGAFGGLLPDLVDLPLDALFGRAILHIHRFHHTVRRRYAVWGILAQVVTAGTAGLMLWLASCR
jgi:hypothetical protein